MIIYKKFTQKFTQKFKQKITPARTLQCKKYCYMF